MILCICSLPVCSSLGVTSAQKKLSLSILLRSVDFIFITNHLIHKLCTLLHDEDNADGSQIVRTASSPIASITNLYYRVRDDAFARRLKSCNCRKFFFFLHQTLCSFKILMILKMETSIFFKTLLQLSLSRFLSFSCRLSKH